VIIDPGLDHQAILTAIREWELTPIAILSTHGHFDHIGGVASIQNEYDIPFYLHELDLKLLQSANFFLLVAKIKHRISIPEPSVLFTQKREKIIIGNFSFDIFHLPGHSNGSCAFQFDKYLFTGDILYKTGIGRESMPREDKVILKESIRDIFLNFSDNLLVLPGHGSSEYLGKIKEENSELKLFLSN
jgi:glyoxylase-like metal-dependent hydrolase (beta-lactamase superfamily II)